SAICLSTSGPNGSSVISAVVMLSPWQPPLSPPNVCVLFILSSIPIREQRRSREDPMKSSGSKQMLLDPPLQSFHAHKGQQIVPRLRGWYQGNDFLPDPPGGRGPGPLGPGLFGEVRRGQLGGSQGAHRAGPDRGRDGPSGGLGRGGAGRHPPPRSR